MTATMAAKKAGLSLDQVFFVGGAEATAAVASEIQKLEGLQVTALPSSAFSLLFFFKTVPLLAVLQDAGQPLSDQQARQYGLWLESNSR